MKLNVKAFALSCGILCGFGLFCFTWWVILFDGATCDPTWLGSFYRGYNISWGGSFIGLVWAFVDGLIGGLVFAWLYNLLVDKFTNKPVTN